MIYKELITVLEADNFSLAIILIAINALIVIVRKMKGDLLRRVLDIIAIWIFPKEKRKDYILLQQIKNKRKKHKDSS